MVGPPSSGQFTVRKLRCQSAAAVLALALALAAGAAAAHDLDFTYTIVVVEADGTFRADVTLDLDALALGVSQGADSAQVVRRLRALPQNELERRIEQVRADLVSRVTLRFDGVPVRSAPSFPEHGRSEDAAVPTLLGLTARFIGTIPPGARTLTVEVERRFPPVYLTVLDVATGETVQQALARGATSDAIVLAPGSRVPPSRVAVAGRYLRLGFTHILPEGVDHILFVVGLFLLSATLGPLLWQVTAFTLAHTLTLALSTYGVVRLAPSIVEPLIALSIAYVAIENVFTKRLTPWRPAVVFGFGLLHGLGFAGVLGELGIPERERVVALLGFNAGVELGQLAVLALAAAAIGRLRNQRWYRTRVTIPLSVIIAIMGVYWAWERL